MKKLKICHLTSVHPRYDTRIFLKECSSLASAGFDVALIVADGLGDEVSKGVKILDTGTQKGLSRIKRMTQTVNSVYAKCLEIDADIYHFHDPELLRIGLKLKKLKKQVIYDVHEDVPRQILSKQWIPTHLRKSISFCFERYENHIAKKLSAVICATPFIRDRYLKINPNSIDINNYPILGEFDSSTPWCEKHDEVCYVGGITEVRGIKELVNSLSSTTAKLNLAGNFTSSLLEEEMFRHENWQKVNYHGIVSRKEVSLILAQSKIGIVTLHPIINYLDSLPIKMFEYMAAGIPIIASDFPYWHKVLEPYDCALFVDPYKPQEIAEAIDKLLDDNKTSEEMGKRAKLAANEYFSWIAEEKKLIQLYKELTNV
ncbi:glycosyltransferase [Lentisphaera profundi]|uniref:Glycosyltransferase n=1 Tax=Lentisphaera profundi TaxID=1658616 RepID=A0ABY7W4H8_9BACT|nr:glycosyltransferase [Lentisphaera profundi]WDE99148.1 glycosyltransferase [Lentisphaera profundi]